MIFYQLESPLYDYSFERIAEKAKAMAIQKNVAVQFICMGVMCFVDRNTNLALLGHDFQSQCKLVKCYKELEALREQVYGEGYKNLYRLPKPTTYNLEML